MRSILSRLKSTMWIIPVWLRKGIQADPKTEISMAISICQRNQWKTISWHKNKIWWGSRLWLLWDTSQCMEKYHEAWIWCDWHFLLGQQQCDFQTRSAAKTISSVVKLMWELGVITNRDKFSEFYDKKNIGFIWNGVK